MSNSQRPWGKRIVLVLVAAVLVPVTATVLYNFPPTEYSFYPRCFLFSMTGLHCPGCGATRCVGALVRGNVIQALAYNPLFVLALPLLILGCAQLAWGMWAGRTVRAWRWPAWSIKVLLMILIAYGIARNVDVYPLNLLAPHELVIE